jgi:hypothetical protein
MDDDTVYFGASQKFSPPSLGFMPPGGPANAPWRGMLAMAFGRSGSAALYESWKYRREFCQGTCKRDGPCCNFASESRKILPWECSFRNVSYTVEGGELLRASPFPCCGHSSEAGGRMQALLRRSYPFYPMSADRRTRFSVDWFRKPPPGGSGIILQPSRAVPRTELIQARIYAKNGRLRCLP